MAGSRPPRTTVDYGEPVDHHEPNHSATFIIVIVSLLFVAVFGGALVGGVVSGDPSNGFFITIIVVSAIAIGVAAGVSLRYYFKNKASEQEYNKEIRGTFTRSGDEENEYDEEEEHYDHRRHYGVATPVDARIKEIKPRSVAGDISALSPHSYDVESYVTRENESQASRNYGQPISRNQRRERGGRRGLFDFASVASSRRSARTRREDPPEEAGPSGYGSQMNREGPKDPAAPKAATDGQFIEDDDTDVGLNSPSFHSRRSAASKYEVEEDASIQSFTSRYDVETDNDGDIPTSEDRPDGDIPMTKDKRDDDEESGRKRGRSKTPRARSRSKSKSPARGRSRSKSLAKEEKFLQETIAPFLQETIAPPPPPKSKKNQSSTPAAKSKTPRTPAASEAGSAVSSIFFKPFNGFFGKKRPASEAGNSEASSYIKGQGSEGETSGYNTNMPETTSDFNASEGRPPKPDMSNKRKPGLATINGNRDDRYAPSTPGKSSARPAPSPSGSSAPSEFRSTAGSSVFSAGVASSTFNPAAHERALRRVHRNTAHLGANPVNDMPIYYEEEEENSVAPSAVQPSATPPAPEAAVVGGAAYDVFAPPGPIGIVVDTKKHGCIVHSLKKTSPMQGLINPGDLIVALDDVDVRKMDAASLTKLMAKKSQQKERKFTLIPVDY